MQPIRVSCTSKQTGIAQQPKLTSRLHFTCGTDREQNKKDAATRQQAGRNNLIRHGSQDKLDYTSRFVRVIPTFLQERHITEQATVVGIIMNVTGCSSRHIGPGFGSRPLTPRVKWFSKIPRSLFVAVCEKSIDKSESQFRQKRLSSSMRFDLNLSLCSDHLAIGSCMLCTSQVILLLDVIRNRQDLDLTLDLALLLR